MTMGNIVDTCDRMCQSTRGIGICSRDLLRGFQSILRMEWMRRLAAHRCIISGPRPATRGHQVSPTFHNARNRQLRWCAPCASNLPRVLLFRLVQ